MSKRSVSKGKRWEREVARTLTDATGVPHKRVLRESRDGNSGDVRSERVVVQCKAGKRPDIYGALAQAEEAATDSELPVAAIHRTHRGGEKMAVNEVGRFLRRVGGCGGGAVSMVASGASVSTCETYRYALWRDWSGLFDDKGRVCWIMLNPSTADAEEDDPTIRRCMGFAKSWGYSGIIVCNLFAYRATKPADMLYTDDPVGPHNDEEIGQILDSSLTDIVVCAWGQNAPLDRETEVLDIIERHGKVPHALRLTKGHAPAHPLYLPGDLVPAPFKRREAP